VAGFIGKLKVKVIKGTDLAIRDMMTSDPYVIFTLGQQVDCSQFSLAYILEKILLFMFYF